MTSDEILKWLGATLPFVVLFGGWVVNRHIQKANAAKTEAEARLAEAGVDKAAVDVQHVILANTKELLAEARAVQAEKDAVKDERITQLTGRVGSMERRFESLRTSLATHGVWDAAALIELRDQRPDYPEPPPFPGRARHHDDDEL